MAPLRQAADRLPIRAKVHAAAEHSVATAEPHATGQHVAGQRARTVKTDETVLFSLQSTGETCGGSPHEKGVQHGAVESSGTDVPSSTFETSPQRKLLKRTFPRSPLHLRETGKIPILRQSMGVLGRFPQNSDNDTAAPASRCKNSQSSRLSSARHARVHSAADACDRHGSDVLIEAPSPFTTNTSSGKRASLESASTSCAGSCAAFRAKVPEGCVEKEGLTQEARPPAGLRLHCERMRSRRRAASCPCRLERLGLAAHNCSPSCALSSRSDAASCITRPAENDDTTSSERSCFFPLLSARNGSQCVSTGSPRSTGAPPPLQCQQQSEVLLKVIPITKAKQSAAELSASATSVRAVTVSCSPLESPVVCPFYARGLCPAGAAAAAAVRIPLQQVSFFTEGAEKSGSSTLVNRIAVNAPSLGQTHARSKWLDARLAKTQAGASLQPAPEPTECDACTFCMDTCDNVSCSRCLPRRGHQEALPPNLITEDPAWPPTGTVDSCCHAEEASGAAEAAPSRASGESRAASGLRPLRATHSVSGSADQQASLSAHVSAPPGGGPAENQSETTSMLVERGLYPQSFEIRHGARPAPVRSSKVPPDTLKRQITTEPSRWIGSWTPCSWFPYRCLRVLAPPVKPPVAYSQCQVERYCRNGGCWLLANGLIYDALPILYAHPGGPNCLLRKRGVDCSRDFAFHSKRGQQLWSNFVVGRVKPCEGWTERRLRQQLHSSDSPRCQSSEDVSHERVTDARDTDACFGGAAGKKEGAQVLSSAPEEGASEPMSLRQDESEHLKPLHETRTRSDDNAEEIHCGQGNIKDSIANTSRGGTSSLCRIM